MRLVVDIHVHGRFSVATSRSLSLPTLYQAALAKGIDVLGTGDIVHPGWRREAREALREEDGLFRVTPSVITSLGLRAGPPRDVRFILTTEISTIYSHEGRVRKVHHLVCLPSFEAAETLSNSLARIGSVESDGRPILGLKSLDLLDMVLSCDPRAILIPAHIWTPWFSAMGSKSGYDSIDACYGNLASHITAIETGLSSDPAMNWRLSSLDRFGIISNSDAHSAEKLGREATVLRCAPSFDGIVGALHRETNGIEMTIEFFPEEGKYHLDGHRACGVCLDPEDTKGLGGKCPVCGGPLTVGVLHRVDDLADRPPGFRPTDRPGFVRLVPLAEVLGQALGVGPASRAVGRAYSHTLRSLGPELHVLTEVSEADLERVCGDRVAEAVANMRAGQVTTEPGYDGKFGTIHLLRPASRPAPAVHGVGARPGLGCSESAAQSPDEGHADVRRASSQFLVVIAGPGSGKTRLLTERMAATLAGTAHPVRGITFTRAAARELTERLGSLTAPVHSLWSGTLHQLAYELLRGAGREINLYDDRQRAVALRWRLAREGHPVTPSRALRLVQRLSALRHGTARSAAPSFGDVMLRDLYAEVMHEAGAIDYDDLIDSAVEIAASPGAMEPGHLFVDEFQDLDRAQYELVGQIASSAPSLMVIGDPYQSIYGFRGGDPGLLARVQADHQSCLPIHMTRSYRCGEAILRAADAVARREPRMESATGERGTVEILRAGSSQREARMVAGRIKEVLGGLSLERAEARGQEVRGFNDVAVLVRTAGMMNVFARAVAEAGIPCRTVRSTALSEDHYVARVLAWLRLGTHPASLADVLLIRRWAGAATPAPALDRGEEDEARVLAGCSPSEALERVLAREDVDSPDTSRREALRRLARESTDLRQFITRVMSERETGVVDSRAEAVRIMTMHAAKGLEFGAVFVTGFRHGIMPLTEADQEEERRLCYVAMTRARSYVALTYTGDAGAISPFAREIPSDAVAARRGPPRAVQLELDLR